MRKPKPKKGDNIMLPNMLYKMLEVMCKTGRKQMKSRQEMEGNGNVELGNLYSLTLKQ